MGYSRFWLKAADEESKSIPHEFPRSHWLKATGQCVLERYLSATMRTIRPIFQSETARPTLVGPLGPFFFIYFFFLGGGGGWVGRGQFIVVFCLCASKQDSRNFIKRGVNFQTRK